MLTKEAFNALLKTLEEPPAHVVFILATTEEEKLLDTILSRCQVFRMHAPSREMLAKTVTDIAKKEGFKLQPAAADLIALAADGSFRDALGVMQKVILASGDEIGDADEVATIIGAPKSTLLASVIDGLANKNAETALTAIGEAVENHVDMQLFVRLLLERVRAVMLLRNLPNKQDSILAAFPERDHEQLRALGVHKDNPINSHMLLRLLDAAERLGRTSLPQLPLELAVIDICSKE